MAFVAAAAAAAAAASSPSRIDSGFFPRGSRSRIARARSRSRFHLCGVPHREEEVCDEKRGDSRGHVCTRAAQGQGEDDRERDYLRAEQRARVEAADERHARRGVLGDGQPRRRIRRRSPPPQRAASATFNAPANERAPTCCSCNAATCGFFKPRHSSRSPPPRRCPLTAASAPPATAPPSRTWRRPTLPTTRQQSSSCAVNAHNAAPARCARNCDPNDPNI
jgi:hypothetical protein